MLRPAFSFVFSLLLLSSSLARTHGQESVQAEIPETVRQLDQKAAQQVEQEQKLQNDIRTVRTKLTDVDREWKSLLGQVSKIEAEQKQLNEKLKKQLEEANQAFKKYEAAMQAAEKARKAAEEAAKLAAEKKKEAEAAFAASEKAAVVPIETKQALVKTEEQIPPLKESAQAQKKVHDQLASQIVDLNHNLSSLVQSRREIEKQIEEELKAAGQWVSFTDEIAPIFHQRCLPCHNEQTAQGQYNMASYSDVMSAGESGLAITPGDGEFSTLAVMVEDGSMPKEADPLTKEQVEKIKHWIDLGARLDVAANAGTPLIRLMPRVQQPEPPNKYATSIPVTALAFHPQQDLLASSGYREVLLWSLEGKLVKRLTNLAERIHDLAFHPSGNSLAVATGTPGQLGEVKVFDVQTGEIKHDLYIAGDSMFSVSWSPDGKKLAAGGAGGVIAIFEFSDSGSVKETIMQDHSDWVNQIRWSPDGSQLLSASRDKTAKVFDMTNQQLNYTFNKHGQNVIAAAWLNENNQVVTSGGDQRLRIWDAEKRKDIRTIGKLPAAVQALQLLSNNHLLGITSSGHLWGYNPENEKRLLEKRITDSPCSSLAVANDESLIAIGDQSGKIYLLELQEGVPRDDAIRIEWLVMP